MSNIGKPRLSAETTVHVRIHIIEEDDSPPKFDKEIYRSMLLLPKYENVSIVKVQGWDPDKGIHSDIKYGISGGNTDKNIFDIHWKTGLVYVSRPQIIGSTSQYSLDLSVTDGKFTDMSKLNILVKKSES